MVKIKVFVSFNLTACSVEGQQKSLIEDVVGLTDEVDGIHILRGALELIGVSHPSLVIRVKGRGWASKLVTSRKDSSRNSSSKK